MCLGAITELVAVSDENGARVGRLADGSVVTLAFVPEAEAGDQLLVHLGIPIEVLDPAVAAEAVSLRAAGMSNDDDGGAT